MAEDKEHSSRDIWKQIQDIGEKQAKTETQIIGIENAVESGFKNVFHRIDEINTRISEIGNQVHRPQNWVAIAGLIVVLVGGGVSFVNQETKPINSRLIELREDNLRTNENIAGVLSVLADRSQLIGEHNKQLEWLLDWVSRLEGRIIDEEARNADLEERVARGEGRQEILHEQVREIDVNGTRRLNQLDINND